MLTLKAKSLSFSRPTSPSRARSTVGTPVVASALTTSEPVEDATLVSRRVTPPPPPPQSNSDRTSSISKRSSSSSSSSASSRRASPRGTSLVALTPANAPAPLQQGDAGGASITRRTTSQDRDRAFRPIRSLSASASHLTARSKSSDRVSDLASVPSSGGGGAATGPSGKKLGGAGGLMASISKAGLRLTHSQSQPGTSRTGGASAAHNQQNDASMLLSPSLAHHGNFPPASSSLGASSASGTATPQPSLGGGPASSATNIEQFAESFIAKVSLRLGEVVNRTFVPAPHGPGGAVDKQLELAEAPYGGSAVSWKGRPAPRLVKAKEFGERIAAELQAAHHDSYLLRTLLRSAILKTLSLFLTRLSALLLVPSSTDPALHPSVFAAPRSLKEVDSMPLALRYNLHIVRCAYEVKRALSLVSDPHVGVAFPPFVDETLKPWRAKLAELMNRVMGPLVQSARAHIAETCLHARAVQSEGGASLTRAHGAHASPTGGNSALGLHGLAAPTPAPPVSHAGKVSAASQLRSLSLGRSASPAPSAANGAHGAAPGAELAAASAWIRDLAGQFDAFGKVISRLECGVDADKWIVTVATAAAWKGMLNLAARPVVAASSSSSAPKTPSVSGSSESSMHSPQPEKPRRGLLLGGAKKTPSPPHSPPLPAAAAAAGNKDFSATAGEHAHADVAFVRLLFDIESLEARLKAFLASSLSTPAHVLAPAFAASVECPAASTAAGCGLCRTGRTFDDDSSESEDDDDDNDHAAANGSGDPRLHRPGHESARESRLALSAMREAMQALSAAIVVVRASHHLDALRAAVEIRGAAVTIAPAATTTPGLETPQPMTPSTLFARSGAPPAAIPPSTSMLAARAPAVPAAPLQSSLATCPTLNSALLTMPPLVLLHLVAARVSAPFAAVGIVEETEKRRGELALRLPHETWNLREGWTEYVSELRGFAAGEEWAPEVAVELGTEAKRVLAARKEAGLLTKTDEVALEALEVVARKTIH
ncbi:hypothetical protein JCM3774_004365 [Rhodotorula dairenensis]